MKQFVMRMVIAMLVVVLAACGNPEEKKMKFFDRGKSLYEQEEYTKARLEFKNALQIDPNFAEGYYWLGMIHQKKATLERLTADF